MPVDLGLADQSGTLLWSRADGVEVVFGLDWSPLVGGEPSVLGRRRARALRATHYLVMGDLAAVVGCGVVPKRNRQDQHKNRVSGRRLHAAAAMFASAHSEGVIAAVYAMAPRGYWLVAVNAGLILAQTDRWYAEREEVDSVLFALKARFPSMHIMKTDVLDEESPPEWMTRHSSIRTQLQSLVHPGWKGTRLMSLMLVVGVVVWIMTDRGSDRPVELPQEQPDMLWRQIYADFSRNHPVHHPDQIFKVVSTWHQAPLNPGGWKLKQIMCEPMAMDWYCAARYQRRKMLALSEKLDAVKPQGWTAEFIDLDHGILRWQVLAAASAFEPVPASIPMKEWISYLQSMTPVFEAIQIGTGTSVSFAAPVGRQGMILERPPFIKPLKRRTISIKGPMRSISTLRGLTIPVRWRGLQLDIGQPTGQGIRRSELTVSLTGEIFEISE